jgi:hydrogenase expression/formation protein HypC
MCVSVPMQVVEIEKNAGGLVRGKACYGGIVKDVSLQMLPDVRVGDYVMVQFGLATTALSPDEARETLELLKQLDELMFKEESI